MGKKKMMVYIEEELGEEAKELGFNISKLLKEAIKRMKEPKTSKNCSDNPFYSQNSHQAVDGTRLMPSFEPSFTSRI